MFRGRLLSMRRDSLLSRVRWLFVLCNVLLAMAAPVVVTYDVAPGGRRSAVMAVAFIGLGVWAVAYYRVEGRHPALEVVPFGLLLVGGLAAEDWELVLGRLVLALFLQALYLSGNGRLLFLGFGYSAVGLAVRGPGTDGVVGIVTGAVILFSFVYLMQAVASTMSRHQRLSERDSVLTRVTGELLSERDPVRLGEVVANGALRLTGVPDAMATVWRAEGDDLVLVASAGSRPANVSVLSLADLPDGLWEVYLDGKAVLIGPQQMARVDETFELPQRWRSTVAAPIVVDGRPAGMLAIHSLTLLDTELVEVVQRFANGVSLAQQLAEREAILAGIIENSPDVIAVADPSGDLSFVSPAMSRWTGLDVDALEGSSVADVLWQSVDGDALDLAGLDGGAPAVLHLVGPTGGNEVEVTCTLRADGSRVLNIRDVSERMRLEAEITHRAFHDTVTGLPNRSHFLDRLGPALGPRADDARTCAVAFLDVDDFKAVNDRLGHAAGDGVLVEIADRLRRVTRKQDVAARLGGDEFALLLHDVRDAAHADAIVARILRALRPPLSIDGNEVRISFSAGVAVIEGTNADEVLRNADAAMYSAKQGGKNRSARFDPRMHAAARGLARWSAELVEAVSAGQFELVYVPVMDLVSGAFVGVEAAPRWRHPDRGPLDAPMFLPAARDSGMVVELDRWALAAACTEVGRWGPAVDGRLARLSVRLSDQFVHAPGFAGDVAETLADSGLRPSQLTLEISQAAFVDDVDEVSVTVGKIRRTGVQVAIVDVGRAPLELLPRLPIDAIRLDDGLVDGITGAGAPRDVHVEAVVKFATTLRLPTLAPGVVHDVQVAALASWGCTHAQGELWGRAVAADAAFDLFRGTDEQALADVALVGQD